MNRTGSRSRAVVALLFGACAAFACATAATPVADAGGPYVISEGGQLVLSGSGVPDPGQTIAAFSWDLNDDGSYDDASGESPALAWATLETFGIDDDGSYPVVLLATQSDSATAIDSTTLIVLNAQPEADAGGPYVVTEGGSVTLDGSGSTDPSSVDTASLVYEWELSGNAFYDDVSGVAPEVAWVDLVDAGIDNDGSYTIALRVTDPDGNSDADTTTIVVSNVPPTANAGGPYTIDEGEAVCLDASGSTDPGPTDGAALIYEWDLDDDGSFDDAAGQQPFISWETLVDLGIDDGGPSGTVYPVLVRVTDDSGAQDTAGTALTILNAIPTASSGGPYSTVEGGEVRLVASASSDPSPVDDLTFAWDLDSDGTFGETNEPSNKAAEVDWSTLEALAIQDDGDFNIAVRVTDKDGGQSTASTTLHVTNTPPTPHAGGPYTIVETDSVQLDASGSCDPSSVDNAALSYAWDINGDGSFGGPGEPSERNPNLSWTDLVALGIEDDGMWSIAVRVSDEDAVTEAPSWLTVINADPVGEAGGPYVISEGNDLVLDASGSSDPNPNNDPLTYVWDLKGDGTVIHAGGPSISIPWAALVAEGLGDDGSFTLLLTVADDDGGSATDTADWTVGNLAPSIVQCPENRSAVLDQPISGLAASFDDPGADAWSASVDWGDGSSNDLSGIAKLFLLPEHTYTTCTGDEETFTVTVVVRDDDGGSDWCTFTISVVNDTTPPTASFTVIPPPTTQDAVASFEWAGIDDHTSPGQIRYSTCQDGYGWTYWSSATSTTLGPLSPGDHTFEVRAQDEAGNDSDPIQYEWTIEAPPPSILGIGIVSPENLATYLVGVELIAMWHVAAATAATGTYPNGARIDTSRIGAFTFAVTATNESGTVANVTVDYWIVPVVIPVSRSGGNGETWSFLDRPLPTVTDEDDSLTTDPVRYVYGETIRVAFRLVDAFGEPLQDEPAFIDVCRATPLGGMETCTPVAFYAVHYDSESQTYACDVPTLQSSKRAALLPGRYQLTLSFRSVPVASVWVQIVSY